MDDKLQLRTSKLRELIEKSPAGGVFHDAQTHGHRVLHAGFANEQHMFIVETESSAYIVTLERMR